MNINEQIQNRILYSGFDDSTYYTQDLFKFVVTNINDPNVLFKLKIYGYYKRRYKWTDKECQWFIDNNVESSVSWTSNGVTYLYDWGSGENSITNDIMHKPHLDHFIPKSKGGSDKPENMRIRVQILNESKGATDSDAQRIAIIEDNFHDLNHENKLQVISILQKSISD